MSGNVAVIDHLGEDFDLVIEVVEAVKEYDGVYRLFAPSGRFFATLVRQDEGWEVHVRVQSDGDRIHLEIPDSVAEGFLEQVEVSEQDGVDKKTA